jgi:hypothetical protein
MDARIRILPRDPWRKRAGPDQSRRVEEPDHAIALIPDDRRKDGLRGASAKREKVVVG